MNAAIGKAARQIAYVCLATCREVVPRSLPPRSSKSSVLAPERQDWCAWCQKRNWMSGRYLRPVPVANAAAVLALNSAARGYARTGFRALKLRSINGGHLGRRSARQLRNWSWAFPSSIRASPFYGVVSADSSDTVTCR